MLDPATARSPLRPTVLFATVTVLWGVPYLLISVALDGGMGPLAVAGVRVLLGAAALLPWTGRNALALLASAPVRLITLASVEVVAPFSLIAWGEQTVGSSTAGVLIATEPAFTLVAAFLVGLRGRIGPALVGGVAVGFSGVVVLLGTPGAGIGAIPVLAAAGCYGLGAVLVDHWFADAPRLPLAAAMLSVACVPLVGAAGATNAFHPLSVDVLGALLVLGLMCTAGGFVSFFGLIRAAGPTPAATITYTAPLVALALGASVDGEPLTMLTLCGTALVLAGAWMSSAGRRAPHNPTRAGLCRRVARSHTARPHSSGKLPAGVQNPRLVRRWLRR